LQVFLRFVAGVALGFDLFHALEKTEGRAIASQHWNAKAYHSGSGAAKQKRGGWFSYLWFSYSMRMHRKSFTFVKVGPVTTE
jgi:hypothetical protein